MDKNQTEIYGEFTYADSITYEELLDIEKFLQEQLDMLFLDAGAEHLDFTPLGDLLMLQCAFECRNLEILRDVAEEIAAILPDGIAGRILCLEKNLASCHIFWIRGGQWQEKEWVLPATAPANTPAHEVTRLSREDVYEREQKAREEAQAASEQEAKDTALVVDNALPAWLKEISQQTQNLLHADTSVNWKNGPNQSSSVNTSAFRSALLSAFAPQRSSTGDKTDNGEKN